MEYPLAVKFNNAQRVRIVLEPSYDEFLDLCEELFPKFDGEGASIKLTINEHPTFNIYDEDDWNTALIIYSKLNSPINLTFLNIQLENKLNFSKNSNLSNQFRILEAKLADISKSVKSMREEVLEFSEVKQESSEPVEAVNSRVEDQPVESIQDKQNLPSEPSLQPEITANSGQLPNPNQAGDNNQIQPQINQNEESTETEKPESQVDSPYEKIENPGGDLSSQNIAPTPRDSELDATLTAGQLSDLKNQAPEVPVQSNQPQVQPVPSEPQPTQVETSFQPPAENAPVAASFLPPHQQLPPAQSIHANEPPLQVETLQKLPLQYQTPNPVPNFPPSNLPNLQQHQPQPQQSMQPSTLNAGLKSPVTDDEGRIDQEEYRTESQISHNLTVSQVSSSFGQIDMQNSQSVSQNSNVLPTQQPNLQVAATAPIQNPAANQPFQNNTFAPPSAQPFSTVSQQVLANQNQPVAQQPMAQPNIDQNFMPATVKQEVQTAASQVPSMTPNQPFLPPNVKQETQSVAGSAYQQNLPSSVAGSLTPASTISTAFSQPPLKTEAVTPANTLPPLTQHNSYGNNYYQNPSAQNTSRLSSHSRQSSISSHQRVPSQSFQPSQPGQPISSPAPSQTAPVSSFQPIVPSSMSGNMGGNMGQNGVGQMPGTVVGAQYPQQTSNNNNAYGNYYQQQAYNTNNQPIQNPVSTSSSNVYNTANMTQSQSNPSFPNVNQQQPATLPLAMSQNFPTTTAPTQMMNQAAPNMGMPSAAPAMNQVPPMSQAPVMGGAPPMGGGPPMGMGTSVSSFRATGRRGRPRGPAFK